MELQKYVVTRMNKKTGEITVESFNFTGEACINDPVVKLIKKSIGHDTFRVLKPEFYEEEVVSHRHIELCG